MISTFYLGTNFPAEGRTLSRGTFLCPSEARAENFPEGKFSSRGLENLYPGRMWNPCKTLFSIMESQFPMVYIEFYQTISVPVRYAISVVLRSQYFVDLVFFSLFCALRTQFNLTVPSNIDSVEIFKLLTKYWDHKTTEIAYRTAPQFLPELDSSVVKYWTPKLGDLSSNPA